MGTDIDSSLRIGFDVQESELLVTKSDGVRCSHGCVPSGKAKFCPEHGSRFQEWFHKEATPAFAAWCAANGYRIPKNLDGLGDVESTGKRGAEAFVFFDGSPTNDADYDSKRPRRWALGFHLATSAGSRGGEPDPPDGTVAFDEGRRLADRLADTIPALGLTYRPIRLYLSLYVSVLGGRHGKQPQR